ncbi:hypothetical protein E2C01_062330 [Portunus trituberculatus]|uniref:Uncharacterized protein n=1 Tax=Portunus trituberculatus TaxID=210409 RepID=A0A5B7HEU4_PORTR|nr:hypothetical protein [Portunus trituberculatus]
MAAYLPSPLLPLTSPIVSLPALLTPPSDPSHYFPSPPSITLPNPPVIHPSPPYILQHRTLPRPYTSPSYSRFSPSPSPFLSSPSGKPLIFRLFNFRPFPPDRTHTLLTLHFLLFLWFRPARSQPSAHPILLHPSPPRPAAPRLAPLN